MCAVVRLRVLMARQAVRLITNPPIVSAGFLETIAIEGGAVGFRVAK
jgi:hypothetical protein